MLNTNFTDWPKFSEEEGEIVKQTLLSNKVNYWTGSECREFEKELFAALNSKYSQLLDDIESKKELTEDIVASLKGIIEETRKLFLEG